MVKKKRKRSTSGGSASKTPQQDTWCDGPDAIEDIDRDGAIGTAHLVGGIPKLIPNLDSFDDLLNYSPLRERKPGAGVFPGRHDGGAAEEQGEVREGAEEEAARKKLEEDGEATRRKEEEGEAARREEEEGEAARGKEEEGEAARSKEEEQKQHTPSLQPSAPKSNFGFWGSSPSTSTSTWTTNNTPTQRSST